MNKTREKLIELADNAFRDYILRRDGKICKLCGKRWEWRIQCSHLFSKAKYNLRWNELNAHAQCSGCNKRHEHNPHVYIVWFIKEFGLEMYLLLYEENEKKVVFSDEEIIKLAEYYNSKL